MADPNKMNETRDRYLRYARRVILLVWLFAAGNFAYTLMNAATDDPRLEGRMLFALGALTVAAALSTAYWSVQLIERLRR